MTETREAYNARKSAERKARLAAMSPQQLAEHRSKEVARVRQYLDKSPEAVERFASARRQRHQGWPGYFRLKAQNIRNVGGPSRGIEVSPEFNAEYLLALHGAQAGKCVLTGRVMTMDRWPDTCSVDRIVPSQGYVPGNVRLITWQANAALGKSNDDDLRRFCRDVLSRG